MSSARVIKGTVITVVVAILCFLPPIVHFVTGPLSPLIGGYLAGNRIKLRSGEAFLVGVLLAAIVGVPIPWALNAFHVIRVETAALVFFSIVGALWFGVLGGAASAIGGGMALKEDQSQASH